MRNARQMALCGVFAALGGVVLMLGSVITVASWCAAMLAGLMTLYIRRNTGLRLAWTYWGAVSLLGLMLSADREAVLAYVYLMGWYPLVRPRLERIRFRPLRRVVKAAVFAGTMAMLTGILALLMGTEAVLAELRGPLGAVLAVVTALALGTYDVLLGKLDRPGKWVFRIPGRNGGHR